MTLAPCTILRSTYIATHLLFVSTQYHPPYTLISMSNLLGKAGKKLFERHLEQYAPVDPLYETYVDKNGKQKRRKVHHNVYFV